MMSTMTGKLLREQRVRLELLQNKVAKEVGVTPTFWNRVENGHCELPPKRVEKVAKILKLPVADISFALQHDLSKNLNKKIKT